MDNITSSVTVQVANIRKLDAWDDVTIIKAGPLHTLVKWSLRKTKCHIKMLPGGKYKVLSTGEVKDIVRTKSKGTSNMPRVFENLRQLIRCNFSNAAQNQAFITLTYRRNERNSVTVYEDFEDFWKRLKWHCKGHKLDYISVLEPQARGAWHLHVMVKSDQADLWIDKNKLKDIWGRERGNAYIERLKSDDVGAYYVSYFTHLYENETHNENMRPISIEEAIEVIRQEEGRHDPDDPEHMKLISKAKIKGGRLGYYPKDVKFYRCSRGILRPTRIDTMHVEVEDEHLGKPSHEYAKHIFGPDSKHLNTIQRQYYKPYDKNERRKRREEKIKHSKKNKKTETATTND